MSRTTDALAGETSTGPGPQLGDVEAGRVDLFGVPVWTGTLDVEPDTLSHLIEDIVAQLEVQRLPDVPGRQTGSIVQDWAAPWWVTYHEALVRTTDEIAACLQPAWSERFWRTWAVRFERLGDYRPEHWWIHCHSPATFSCVVGLTVPEHLVGTPGGATVLRNPQAGTAALTSAQREWHGPSNSLSVLIFPGPIEHHPEVPTAEPDSWMGTRTLIVTDVCYY